MNSTESVMPVVVSFKLNTAIQLYLNIMVVANRDLGSNINTSRIFSYLLHQGYTQIKLHSNNLNQLKILNRLT